MKKRTVIAALSLIIIICLTTIFVVNYPLNMKEGAKALEIKVATTTSLCQIGLVDALLDDFKSRLHLNIEFHVIAKGSGEALRLLSDGSACIGFVHAPSLEQMYMSEGKIHRLAIFAYNEFVIVGPPSDPANIKEAKDALEAFKRIYRAGEKGLAFFVSRGDMSGTNVRELQLWKLVGLNPDGRPWYFKSAQGMAQTLLMAENLRAYTMTDVGTYLSLVQQGKLRDLTILLRDARNLLNVYSAYISKSPLCDDPLIYYIAFKLRMYLLSEGQKLIEERYKGLLNPVGDDELMVLSAWKTLAGLGQP